MLAWGEDKTIDLSLPEYSNGFTIENNGTYIFKGMYPSTATPEQDIDGTKKAVINVAAGKEATIILEDVSISLTGANQCPLSARDAKKVTVILKGENTLSTINNKGDCPGLWAPEEGENELIIQNGETDGVLGVLNVQGAYLWPGIGVYQGGKGKIMIDSGYIIAKGGISGAGIGSSYGNGGYIGTITINNGIITAIGGNDENQDLDGGAGIGGGAEGSGGTIIIINGIVKAIGGGLCAGIGGGCNGSAGTITIKGGNVFASGGYEGAGIGGGNNKSCGIVTINDGIINAIGGEGAAGIGNGDSGCDGTIIINGGTVNATGGDWSVGIGGGDWESEATFSTGINGNAFIVASSISDQSGKDSNWQGVIFEANNGSIYKTPSLSTDAKIPDGKTLKIESGQTLTINNGITLVNLGTIDNNSGGTITNNGTILNVASGNITGNSLGNAAKIGYAVTFDLNYKNAPDKEIRYIEEGQSVNYSPARKNFTFDGWYNAKSDGSLIKTINQDVTVYAHWTLKDFTTKDNVNLTADYGSKYEHTFSADELSDDILIIGGLKGITLNANNNLPDGLILSGLTISGTPTIADETGKDITFTVIAQNDVQKDITIKFIVNKVELTVASNNKTITKEYDGKNIVTTQDVLKLEGIIKDDKISLSDYILTYNDTDAGNDIQINIPTLSLEGTAMDNYSLIQPSGLSLTGAITQKELTVTPKADQKLYNDEDIKFDVTGAVDDENPSFNGTLQIKDGKVIDKDLSLTGKFKKNYSFTITPNVDIVLVNEETVPILVKLLGTIDENSAYKDKVTFIPPEGFEIALIRVTKLKATPSFGSSFDWDKPGKYRLTYQLKRNSDNKESSEYDIDITVVTSTPVDPTPPEPVDPPISKFYTVALPAIEGITTDPVAGSYKVADYSTFTFSLTVDEGYRELSQPVVKANGVTIKSSDGKNYVLKWIHSDTDIEIEGIVKDNPTANELINSGIGIRTRDKTVYVTVPRVMRSRLIDISGRIIRNTELLPGENRIGNIASGIYVLVLDGVGSEMIIVK